MTPPVYTSDKVENTAYVLGVKVSTEARDTNQICAPTPLLLRHWLVFYNKAVTW